MNFDNKQLLKGTALMLGAMSVVPMLDVIAKILSESYPVIQISWARFAFIRCGCCLYSIGKSCVGGECLSSLFFIYCEA